MYKPFSHADYPSFAICHPEAATDNGIAHIALDGELGRRLVWEVPADSVLRLKVQDSGHSTTPGILGLVACHILGEYEEHAGIQLPTVPDPVNIVIPRTHIIRPGLRR